MTTYQFDDCEIDSRLLELRIGGVSVAVPPLVFSLLLYLVAHRDRVVTKGELHEQIWPGKVVSDATLSSAIKAARRALGDDGNTQKYIRTVHGRGFRFVGPLVTRDSAHETGPDSAIGEPGQADTATAGRPHSHVPAIVVLPFVNMSGDSGQEYLADGITEDIITELSRFRSLAVIARTSSFTYKGRDQDVRAIGKELGVDYVVEGSVRRAGSRMRIIVQLVESATGNHIWAERYDRSVDDIFDVQDELTQSVVATVGGRLEDHRLRSGGHLTHGWGVYDLILQAQALHYRILKTCNSEARDILVRALSMEPGNARAHSLMGAVLLLDYTMAWAESSQSTLDTALEHGRSSVQLDNTDSLAHARLGETLIHINLSEAKLHFEKALELNPNDSESRALCSLYFMATGDTGRSLRELEIVRRMDPFERVWIPWFRGEALFMAKRYREAIASFEEVTEPINDLRLTLAACYAQIDEADIARALLRRYLAQAKEEMPNFPGFGFEGWIDFVKTAAGYQDDAHHRLIVDAMRKAWPAATETDTSASG